MFSQSIVCTLIAITNCEIQPDRCHFMLSHLILCDTLHNITWYQMLHGIGMIPNTSVSIDTALLITLHSILGSTPLHTQAEDIQCHGNH